MTIHGCAYDSNNKFEKLKLMKAWSKFYKTGEHRQIPKKSFARYEHETEGEWYRTLYNDYHTRIEKIRKGEGPQFYNEMLKQFQELEDKFING
jgi:hypothetical protein